ncbi:hypothetical protein DRQ17_04540 [bacterium]|nr:MAG: hypothetical protein DRQ17_04540 [bacterium]RKZ21957.1 MAG: hypothetical protein DRQ23_06070 [bacterium]
MAEEILLGVETSRKIEDILNGFLRASGARCVFLVSRSGQLISELGFTRDLKVLSIVALLSGIFSATEKIARLIKEELSELLLEGKEWNVYFKYIGKSYVFITMYKENSILGVIKVESKIACKKLLEILTEEVPIPRVEKFEEDTEGITKLISKFFEETWED